MRYHQGYPEKHWKFLYSLDAFLFFTASIYILSLIVEYGFFLTPDKMLILGWLNLFVLGVSLFELFIKFILCTSKSYFFSDEYMDFVVTNILFLCAAYTFYVHFYKLGLPFYAESFIRPSAPHWVLLKFIMFLAVLTQFKEFNRILLGLKIKPVQLLVGGFFTLIILGTVLLLLPGSTTKSISTINALFMSTSATCVTGLTTLQPNVDFTLLGQIILLFLIQVGGLGIMTISAFVALILRGSFGIEGRRIMSESIEMKAQHQLRTLLKQIIRFTLFMETFGVIVFTWRFNLMFDDFPKALYYGIFHSISGFCNAGFSLFSNNLVRFQKDPVFLLTMSILVIAGGIGFLVISDLNKFFLEQNRAHKKQHLSVQTKVVLYITTILLIGGTCLIFFTERANQLASLPAQYQWLNAFFSAVTPRTAGFNTIDIGLLNPATLLIILSLMVIGGASGSTAGGIKVNTLGVLFALLKSTVQGKSKVVLFERTIPNQILNKAIAITFFAMLITVIASLFMLLTNQLPFTQTLFEAVSAFNTVGLSMGITNQMGTISKIILTLLMFMGRVGPVSFVVALSQREKREDFIDYPDEHILVG